MSRTKEEKAAYIKEWTKANPEARKKAAEKYRKANLDAARKRASKWGANNQEKIKSWGRRRIDEVKPGIAAAWLKMKVSECTPEMLCAAREVILTRRSLRELNKTLKELNGN